MAKVAKTTGRVPRKRELAAFTWIASIAGIFYLLVPQCAVAQDASVEEILNSTANHFRFLDTVSFGSRLECYYTESGKRISHVEYDTNFQTMTFFEDSGNFRSEVQILDEAQGVSSRSVSLRNESEYQFYLPDSESLTFSKGPRLENASFGLNPLLFAYYLIAFDTKDRQEINELRGPEIWDRVADRVIRQEREIVGDYECVALTVEAPVPVWEHAFTVNTIYFAGDLDYYPIHGEQRLPTGALIGEFDIEEFSTFKSDGHSFVVPTKGILRAYGKEGDLAHTMVLSIDEASLRVNEPIDPSVFSIPKTSVKVLIDGDTGAYMAPREPDPRHLRGLDINVPSTKTVEQGAYSETSVADEVSAIDRPATRGDGARGYTWSFYSLVGFVGAVGGWYGLRRFRRRGR